MMNMDGMLLAVDEARAQIDAARDENARLRGRLRECRRQNRQLQRDCTTVMVRARRDAAYWRHMMLAVCGLVGALVCLIHTIAILWAMG